MSTSLRRSGATALVLSLGFLLAACGDDTATEPRASDPAGSEATAEPTSEPSTSEPSETATPTESTAATSQQAGPVPVTGNAGVDGAVVVSGSEVGGEVSPLAFPLESRQEREDFGAGFERGFGRAVAQAARGLDAGGTTTWGTAVAVGCEGPRSVRIDAGEAGFEVTPRLPAGTVQCLVPVTYVVVFAAPAA